MSRLRNPARRGDRRFNTRARPAETRIGEVTRRGIDVNIAVI